MTTERKIVISIGVICIICFIACTTALAFSFDFRMGIFVGALFSWWLGSAIADALLKDDEP